MKLVIVESPAKAKTIEKFLGSDYRVVASYGHIRDLPGSAKEVPSEYREKPWARMAVDTDNDFRPVYIVPKESQKRVKELRKMVAKAEEVLLATDEDREGESISWHLKEVLQPDVPVRRITFHEITRSAIEEALDSARDVDEQLVRAQETRRILDRLYGYSLSPVLWKKVRTKLSAGRVQSVALRLVVEREEERQRFRSTEYWDVRAHLTGDDDLEFTADLVEVDGRRLVSSRDFDSVTGELDPDADVLVLDREAAEGIAEASLDAVPWRVRSVERKETQQRPSPPFTTSTLQQVASSRLRMSPARTMRLAQKLYEGIDLGEGEREGLITYMRTDSLHLSKKAMGDAERFVKAEFGDRYHQGWRFYRTKSKGAQEAHEAIRPSEMGRTPEVVARYLRKDELALYRLIWERAVASQMSDAVLDRTTVEIEVALDGRAHVFRARGSVLRFPGYQKVWGGSRKDTLLPELEEDQPVGGPEDDERVRVREATPEEHETRPPPRYTEASLVKKLEEEGIGRPSTYTPILTTIQERDYAVKRSGYLVPTYVGMAVTHLLREHFPQYVDIGFTARMEDALDDIAEGEEDWVEFLSRFYKGDGNGSTGLLEKIEEEMPRIDYPRVPVGRDPDTGKEIRVRVGRNYIYVQRGEGDEADRATVPVDLLIDELTPDKALELIEARQKAEEPLGRDPESGENVYAKVGPYGPYVQLGETDEDTQPKRVGLPRGKDLEDVDLEYALRLLSLPRSLGEDPGTGKEVTAGLGRYGPYVERDGTYRNLRSEEQIWEVTLEEALELLAQKKGKRVIKELGEHPESGAEVQVLDGRYGPYVTDGDTNASLPRDAVPEDTTLDQAVALLEDKKAKGSGKKGGRKRKGRRKKRKKG